VCPCRKDRTLREGRQRLHLWGRRREPIVLWLEGADDLTPEAQAFLRRILETHAEEVQFVLECRDPGKLQEPIRSRCSVETLQRPERGEMEAWAARVYGGRVRIAEILDTLEPDEVSWRRLQQTALLQLQSPAAWNQVVTTRGVERALADKLHQREITSYLLQALNPEVLLEGLLAGGDAALLERYGERLDAGGSTWAFLASALPVNRNDAESKEE
jgi:DNA polymerase III delta prime subunit